MVPLEVSSWPMTTTITIPPPERHELHVRGVGDCVMHDLARSGEVRVGRHLRSRPYRANYRACVDDLISSCLAEPSLSPAEVSALPPAARTRLRFAALEVVGAAGDYRRLAGSHLGRDERAYMAMRWRRERFSHNLTERLRSHRRRLEKQALTGGPRSMVRDRAKPAYTSAFKTLQGLGFAGSVLGRLNPALTLARSNPAHLAALRDISGVVLAARPKQPLVPDTAGLARAVGAEHLGAPFSDQLRIATRSVAPNHGLVVGDNLRGLASGLGFHDTSRRRLDGFASGLGLRLNDRRRLDGFTSSLGFGLTDRHIDDIRALAGGLPATSRLGATWRPVLPMGLRDVTGLGGLHGFRSVQALVRRSWEVADVGELVVVVYDQLRERLPHSPLRFLMELLDVRSAVTVMRLEAKEGQNAALDALAPAVTDDGVLEALETGIEVGGDRLSQINRRRLLGALGKLAQTPPNWVEAHDGLLPGVESAFRSAALADGTTVRRRKKGKSTEFLNLPNHTREVSGIELLFPHIELEDERVNFLIRLVFGGAGDPFRHGWSGQDDETEEDYRRHMVALLIALAIWVDRWVDSRAIDAIADACEAHVRQRRRPT